MNAGVGDVTTLSERDGVAAVQAGCVSTTQVSAQDNRSFLAWNQRLTRSMHDAAKTMKVRSMNQPERLAWN